MSRDSELYSSEIGGVMHHGSRSPGRVRHPRADDALHRPAEAHPLPPAGEQGLHAAHDRPARAVPAEPVEADRRQRDRARLVRLRRRPRVGAPAAGDRRDHGRTAGGPSPHLRVVERDDRRRRPRVRRRRRWRARGVGRALRVRQRPGQATPRRPTRRHRHQAHQRRGRRRAALRARVRHVHAPAVGRRQRDDPQHDGVGHVGADAAPGAVRVAARQPRHPAEPGGRGDPALGVARVPLPPHGDRARRDPRPGDRRAATRS